MKNSAAWAAMLVAGMFFTSDVPLTAAPPSAGITWKTPDKYQSLKPISFVLDDFPKDEFLLIFPEWITAREKSWHVRPNWQKEPTAATATWEMDGCQYRLEVTYRRLGKAHELRWKTTFTNGFDAPLTDVAAFHCFNLVDAPQFKDLSMERTWVAQGDGAPVRLAGVMKTKGPRTMQFYPAQGGLPLEEFERFSRYQVISTQRLNGDRIGVDSVDGKWMLECIVDGDPAYFFNNWESDHGCIHAAPRLGDIDPGKSGVATGRILISPKSK